MNPIPGTVGWVDLTVRDAPALRDFYAAVIGWTPEAFDLGDYADFNMLPPTSDVPAAGICHARGANAGLPPVWMVYFVVDDLDSSVQSCVMRGGTVLMPARAGAGSRFCVIRDPAGAVCALYQPVLRMQPDL
jgi:uncharacterized protein